MSAHIFNNDVCNASRGDDLLGNLFISFSTSEGSMPLKLSRLPIELLGLECPTVQRLYHRHDAGMMRLTLSTKKV